MVGYDYEIMVTPVTNAQYAAYLNAALAAGKVKIADNKVVGLLRRRRLHRQAP